MAHSFRSNRLIALSAAVLLMASPLSASPVTDLYAINAGSYSELGGFVGLLTLALPSERQAFLELTIDRDTDTAQMQILDNNRQRQFGFFGIDEPFAHGVVEGNRIVFRESPFDPFFNRSGELSYVAVLDGDQMRLGGNVFWEYRCCDIPFELHHTGVEASLVPEPGTWLLLGFGLVVLSLCSDRRRNQSFCQA